MATLVCRYSTVFDNLGPVAGGWMGVGHLTLDCFINKFLIAGLLDTRAVSVCCEHSNWASHLSHSFLDPSPISVVWG